ncbi:Iron-sulfur assembly protein 1 [Neolecta irregularis DAH-3]|uniref:Iron-sulfur assembly protein 1 n=1 Tax=Neolecta irregularis (strain DAH-3) TaxID=1198029 RepID=A0A1U7LNF3_NEOID|nr:Iron-sulfur assembly protein 1 [Neolecta irregularis DAH-3]|eukprot:OLL24200.1 Iron-sulfur assembly protein 1 [Neolecta irregularis DAH-3]
MLACLLASSRHRPPFRALASLSASLSESPRSTLPVCPAPPRTPPAPESSISTPISHESSTAAPQRPKRPSLTPRKAAMTLTSAAVARLKDLYNSPSPKLIRVGVKSKGCAGMAYHLEYVDNPGKFDEELVQDGINSIKSPMANLNRRKSSHRLKGVVLYYRKRNGLCRRPLVGEICVQ